MAVTKKDLQKAINPFGDNLANLNPNAPKSAGGGFETVAPSMIEYENVQPLAGQQVTEQDLIDNPKLQQFVDPKTLKIKKPEELNTVSVVDPKTGKNVYNPIGKQGILKDDSLGQDIVDFFRRKNAAPADDTPPAGTGIEPQPTGGIGARPQATTTTETDSGPDILGIIGKTLNDPAVAQLLGRAISGIGKGTDNTTPELMTQNAIIGQVGKRMREDELLDRKDLQAQLDRENDLKKISSKPQTGGNDEPDFWVKQRVKSLQDNIFNNPTWTQDALITQALIANKMNPKEVKGLSLQQKQRALARAQGMGDEYDMLVRGQGVGTTQQPSQPQGQPAQAAPGAAPPGMKIQKNKKTGEIRYVPI